MLARELVEARRHRGQARAQLRERAPELPAGLEEAAALDGVEITHAGTARSDGEIVTAGGRVLNVTGLGATAADARRRAYDAAELIGFVTSTQEGLVAVSAACTHLGCILQANEAAGRFDCPCHRTAFAHDGRLLYSQLPDAPPPLTRLQVRRRDGHVEVLAPRPL